jgi:hypothetical protein
MSCSTPTPAPTQSTTPTPTPSSGSGLSLPGLPGLPNSIPGPASGVTGAVVPLVATADPNAPVLTLPAAQLGADSLSFSGIPTVSLVTVPLADGSRTTVLKLTADSITIDGFLLDVRRATGPSLVTNASKMVLRGNVQVYLDSATATLPDGTGLTFGAATPPPGNELPATLLRINLGLVGVTANSITFTAPHQALHE